MHIMFTAPCAKTLILANYLATPPCGGKITFQLLIGTVCYLGCHPFYSAPDGSLGQ